ncbi:RNA polymerase sigma factor [Sphingopyxis chilensis]
MSASGSSASFDAFYRSQQKRIFHYFRKQVGPVDAPDLVQEAFIRMFRSGAFDRVENPQGYLLRICHNLLIESAGKWRRKQSVLYPLDEARDVPLCPKQDWGIQLSDLRRTYRCALLALPRRTRRIFLMRRLKGSTYREISERLGVSKRGVEYHLSRALAEFRAAVALLE